LIAIWLVKESLLLTAGDDEALQMSDDHAPPL
jgi:hypothetical protein